MLEVYTEAESKPLGCAELRKSPKYIPPHVTEQAFFLSPPFLQPFLQLYIVLKVFKAQALESRNTCSRNYGHYRDHVIMTGLIKALCVLDDMCRPEVAPHAIEMQA